MDFSFLGAANILFHISLTQTQNVKYLQSLLTAVLDKEKVLFMGIGKEWGKFYWKEVLEIIYCLLRVL